MNSSLTRLAAKRKKEIELPWEQVDFYAAQSAIYHHVTLITRALSRGYLTFLPNIS